MGHIRSSAYVMVVGLVFWGVWFSCLLLGPFFSYWVALPSLDVRVCAWFLLSCAMFGGYPWETYSFLWGVNGDGGTRLGEKEGRETTVEIYYMRE